MPTSTKQRSNGAIDLANKRAQPGSRQTREIMHREIIVSGDDPLAKTIAEELRGAGARIIQITTATDLLGAGVHRARRRLRRAG
jgi:ribosomal protein S11